MRRNKIILFPIGSFVTYEICAAEKTHYSQLLSPIDPSGLYYYEFGGIIHL